jgi:hypothetical protein
MELTAAVTKDPRQLWSSSRARGRRRTPESEKKGAAAIDGYTASPLQLRPPGEGVDPGGPSGHGGGADGRR